MKYYKAVTMIVSSVFAIALVSGCDQKKDTPQEMTAEPEAAVVEQVDAADTMKEEVTTAVEDAQETMETMAEDAQETMTTVAEDTQEAMATAAEEMQETMTTVVEGAEETAEELSK